MVYFNISNTFHLSKPKGEEKEDFAEVIKKFLRRNYKGWLPKEESFENVMKLVDDHGVRMVRAAIISCSHSERSSKRRFKNGR
jgi:hypothetical protein